jgi:NADH:ubiquinone oxidoreductase subunit 2 (subunit N)
MTVSSVAALTQSNIKRMLAYSSIAHAGSSSWAWWRLTRGIAAI